MFGAEVVLQDEDRDAEGLWAPRGAAGAQGLVVWGAAAIPYVEFSLLVWWRCVQRGNIMDVLGVKM